MNTKLKILSFLASEGAQEVNKVQVYKTSTGDVTGYQAYYTKDGFEVTCMFDVNGESDGGSVKVSDMELPFEEVIAEPEQEPKEPETEDEEPTAQEDELDESKPEEIDESEDQEVIIPETEEEPKAESEQQEEEIPADTESIEDDLDAPDANAENEEATIIPEPKNIPEQIQLESDLTGIPVEFLMKQIDIDKHY